MDAKRDVEEALTIFDQLSEEDQLLVLEYLREIKEKSAA